MTDMLAALSQAVADHAEAASSRVAGLALERGPLLPAVLWPTGAHTGVAVVAEQSLPEADGYSLVLPTGARVAATFAGRDGGTNVAVLRFDSGHAPAPGPQAAPARLGALVLVLGPATARLGIVSRVGHEWTSQQGGRIDRLIELDAQLGRGDDGALVIDASGGVVGLVALGPRRRVLVIPASTVARVLPPLLADGRLPRGWLGVALQPVALPEALHEIAGGASGLMLVSLASGGPAALAGLLPGDILLALDDVQVAGSRSLAGRLGPDRVGHPCRLRLLRGGSIREETLVVAARP